VNLLESTLTSLPNLNTLTLADLIFVFNNLFEERLAVAEQTRAGMLYIPILQGIRAEIAALPPHIIGGVPLAAALSKASDEYNSFGSALWHFAKFVQDLPTAPPQVKAIVRRAQETFVPERSVFQKGYVDKAATESSLLSVFEKQRADLSTIPTLDGRTLADTVQGFLKASNQIQVLLSSRAQSTQNTSRRIAKSLRTRAVSSLNSFRNAHIDELRANLSPISTFESVWSFIHLIADQRDKPAASQEPSEKI
jgi:hypothetical protein